MLSGYAPQAAAKLAGYEDSAGAVSRLLRAPAVLYALELGLRRTLQGKLVPLAFETLETLVQNADSDRVRLDAAKTILDRAGFAPAKQAPNPDDREPEQMQTHELHALIERLERELGERAAPVNEQTPAQPIEDAEILAPN